MRRLNLKQKKLLAIILIILIVIAYYYLFMKNQTEEIENQNLEIENTSKENNSTDGTQKENKEKIIVHVSGAVNSEGIVELEAGSRIANAIEKAGGIKESADMSEINLAYLLEDGMKIYIPTKEETEANKKNANTQNENYVTSSSGGENSKKYINNIQSSSSKSTSSSKKVNINTATQEELDTLPGIGPSIARKIIEYREQNGKFSNIEDIKEVSRNW